MCKIGYHISVRSKKHHKYLKIVVQAALHEGLKQLCWVIEQIWFCNRRAEDRCVAVFFHLRRQFVTQRKSRRCSWEGVVWFLGVRRKKVWAVFFHVRRQFVTQRKSRRCSWEGVFWFLGVRWKKVWAVCWQWRWSLRSLSCFLSKTLDKWKRTQQSSTLLNQSIYRLLGGGVDEGDVGRHRLGVEVANRWCWQGGDVGLTKRVRIAYLTLSVAIDECDVEVSSWIVFFGVDVVNGMFSVSNDS